MPDPSLPLRELEVSCVIVTQLALAEPVSRDGRGAGGITTSIAQACCLDMPRFASLCAISPISLIPPTNLTVPTVTGGGGGAGPVCEGQHGAKRRGTSTNATYPTHLIFLILLILLALTTLPSQPQLH
jgi:hypothetical protein